MAPIPEFREAEVAACCVPNNRPLADRPAGVLARAVQTHRGSATDGRDYSVGPIAADLEPPLAWLVERPLLRPIKVQRQFSFRGRQHLVRSRRPGFVSPPRDVSIGAAFERGVTRPQARSWF